MYVWIFCSSAAKVVTALAKQGNKSKKAKTYQNKIRISSRCAFLHGVLATMHGIYHRVVHITHSEAKQLTNPGLTR